MITVKLLYRRPDGVTTEGSLITEGTVAIQSVRRYDTTGGEMTTVAFTRPLGGSANLDPGTWRFTLIGVQDGLGGTLSGRDAVSVRAVPASVPTTDIPAGKVNGDGSVDVDDLPEVTTDDQPLAASPEWKVYTDNAIAGVSAGAPSGGPFVAVADTSSLGRTIIAAGDTAAAKTAVGVGNVDNTSDAGKPVSTAQATAIGLKASKSGDTFTGPIVIPAGTLSGHAVNKGQLDAAVASGGGGGLSLTPHPTQSNVLILDSTGGGGTALTPHPTQSNVLIIG